MPYKKVSASYWTVFLHGIAHRTVPATDVFNTSEILNVRAEIKSVYT